MTLALYTTIYPGVEAYLADWYRSVLEQTDRDFELWIGLDTMERQAAEEALEADPGATWVPSRPGDTPASLRHRALAQIAERFDAVILVDSDDVLHPSRVSTAREMLHASELAGCALRLVDEFGSPLGITLELPRWAEPEDVFPRNNIFGLSNSALRCSLLRRCLPIPATAVLVDWFLATRAWLLGAELAFDDSVEMDYRQHKRNMAKLLPPFDVEQVVRDTGRVREHFRLLKDSRLDGAIVGRVANMKEVATDIEAFYEQVVLDQSLLEKYVHALNALEISPLWWSSVANPALRHLWTSKEAEA